MNKVTKTNFETSNGQKSGFIPPNYDPNLQPGDVVWNYIFKRYEPILMVRWDTAQLFWRAYLRGLNAPAKDLRKVVC